MVGDLDKDWVVIDTETSGLRRPIHVVEIAAQRMHGWEPVGEPFRRLLNHEVSIDPGAQRVHGYTEEFLRHEGISPIKAYQDFKDFVGVQPLCSYNLNFDLDRVLIPEWRRLNITPIGQRGICFLRLARRLIRSSESGDHKLQTLRQHFALPDHGAHSALGDVNTVIDLIRKFFKPRVEAQGIASWGDLNNFIEGDWCPPIIQFGKFKGHDFREPDPEISSWLKWLVESAQNPEISRQAKWYLARIEEFSVAKPAKVRVGSPEFKEPT
ncbi:3'-5' exonuclease [Rhodovulum sp. YNF3179]|uniref:3'-5' exonuclease n=1 Tax=Rhodovulum sp. YNF3179 TaxID=3425127 RepID=UPI003D32795B